MTKLAIIIPTYNDYDNLKKTLSLLDSYIDSNTQIIIVDGGSSDKTISLETEYQHIITQFISEPDRGIADAINKGICMATAEYILVFGASDNFLSKKNYNALIDSINYKFDMYLFAVERVNSNRESIHRKHGILCDKFNKIRSILRMPFPHQGMVVSKKFYNLCGIYDVKYKLAPDYDWIIRALKLNPNVKCANICHTYWSIGGIGSTTEINVLIEYHKIRVKNKVPSVLSYIILTWSIYKYKIRELITK